MFLLLLIRKHISISLKKQNNNMLIHSAGMALYSSSICYVKLTIQIVRLGLSQVHTTSAFILYNCVATENI